MSPKHPNQPISTFFSLPRGDALRRAGRVLALAIAAMAAILVETRAQDLPSAQIVIKTVEVQTGLLRDLFRVTGENFGNAPEDFSAAIELDNGTEHPGTVLQASGGELWIAFPPVPALAKPLGLRLDLGTGVTLASPPQKLIRPSGRIVIYYLWTPQQPRNTAYQPSPSWQQPERPFDPPGNSNGRPFQLPPVHNPTVPGSPSFPLPSCAEAQVDGNQICFEFPDSDGCNVMGIRAWGRLLFSSGPREFFLTILFNRIQQPADAVLALKDALVAARIPGVTPAYHDGILCLLTDEPVLMSGLDICLICAPQRNSAPRWSR